MKRKLFSIITALALCLSLCPAGAFAAAGETGLCDHHREHTAECGYAAPAEGRDCGHRHTAECYTLGVLPDADGGDPYAVGADTENLPDCPHTHDGACGYVQADPGTPCGYVCRICPIENLIAALPEQVTEDNADDVRAQLDEILALYRELDEGEQEEINLSRVLTLQEALDAANAPAPADGRAEQQPGDEASATRDGVTLYYATVEEAFQDAENAGSTDTLITLLADAETDGTLYVCAPVTLDCGGHTLTGSGTPTIYLHGVYEGVSSLTLKNGKVENTCSFGAAIVATDADALTVEETAVLEAVSPDSTGLIIQTARNDTIRISGKVTGTISGIRLQSDTLNVESGAVIAGGLYGIDVTYSGSAAINLNGGAITGGESAVHIGDNATPAITVKENMTATLDDTRLTAPITGSTGAGTLVICSDHRPTAWSEDGTRTCPNCSFTQQAVARLEKDGQADYVTSVPAFLRAFTAANSGAAVTLLSDVTWAGTPITPPDNTSFTLRLNGKTMMNTADEQQVFLLSGASSSLTVEGGGSIIAQGSAIEMEAGALTVKGGHIVARGTYSFALDLYGDGAADIYGGTFTGGVQASDSSALKLYGGVFAAANPDYPSVAGGKPLRELLGTVEGKPCAFYDENGDPITGKLDDKRLYGTVTVKECDHSVTEYQTTGETHSLICAACGTALGTPENHTWDGDVCTVCGHVAVVAEVLAGGTTARYETLAEAWDAATAPGVTGAVITLVHDAAGDDTVLSMENGHSVTLRGRGHTISDHTIWAEGGDLRIENCTFSSMYDRVSFNGGTAEIKDTVINGGVEIYGGEAALTGCTTGRVNLSGNAATARLTDCTVNSGSAGIILDYGGTAELTRCTVTGVESGIWIWNGNLTIHSGSFTGTGADGAGLRVASDASSVTLRGGTFSGSAASISIDEYSGLTLGGLLGHTATARYAYYREDGAPISAGLDGTAMDAAVTVKECVGPHEYTHVPGAVVHSLACAGCGAQGTEPCRYDNGTCACGSTLTVALPGDLVYNGEEQAPPAAVTLDGAPLDTGSYGVTYYNNRNAGTVLAVVTGTVDTLPFRVQQTFTIAPAELTVSGVSAESRPYDGTNEVALTAVTLNGVMDADENLIYAIPSCGGSTDGADAGVYASVTLPRLELGGYRARNYTLIQPANPFPASVTIEKAVLSPKTGALDAANRQAHTYTYGLDALLPVLPEGMRFGPGAVTYELADVSLGSYYTGGAVIEGRTLKLPVAAVESDTEGDVGTVTVTIKTGNFEDMTATVNVRSVNKIIPTGAPTLSAAALTYGQPLSAITLSGSMMDGNAPVPGTFTWSSPDSRPGVQEEYAAAWTFTPANNEKYAIVNGTSTIKVVPAPIAGAVIALEPAAFRYDGAAHRPSIAGVTLDGALLTADVDYTAQIPEGTDAGTYTVTLTGKGSYTGTATAAFTVNPVEQKPLDQTDNDGHELRLEVETGLSTVPAALEHDIRYDTPKKIETALRTRVAEVISNVGENIAVFDVTLQYKDDSGVWRDVDPDNFPDEDVTAILPYPAGTGAAGYTFTVQHLISGGAQAGTMETLDYELTADGLKCRFSSLSPVAIGYQAAARPNPGGGSGGGSAGTYAVTVEKPEHGRVTSNRTNAGSGSTVTLTVTPDTGYALDALTVTDSRGNEIKLSAQGGGQYTFTMPGRAVTVKAAFAPLPAGTACDGGADCPSRGFTDLGTVGTWYHEAVDYVLRNNLMGGYGSGRFGPDDTLTRAQFAQILFNKEGRPVVNYLLQYGDVATGAWYAEAVRWAASQGIVSGYGNGMFGPNDNITREQLAVMLWRYAGSPVATDKELHFTDADKAGGYALEALRWAVENGIINGCGNGQLAPKGLATRAQVAQMLKNFLNNE